MDKVQFEMIDYVWAAVMLVTIVVTIRVLVSFIRKTK